VSATLEFEVFTIFPDAIAAFVSAGLMGKAIARELVAVHCTDLRAFTHDRHRSVDDAPFGGGAGMVMKPGPIVEALEQVGEQRGPMHRILLTPSAPRFDQRAAERLARCDRIALLCGRYEGIDDRVREHWVDECLSIGDFVLNGGEVAAAVIIEAVARLREGVLGNPASVTGESFAAHDDDTDVEVDDRAGVESSQGDRRWRPGVVLEHPQYTRPASFRGHEVPPVLLGGDHGAVERWRRRAACLRTWALRPDLRPSFDLGDPIVLAVPAEDLEGEALEASAALARDHGVELARIGGRADRANSSSPEIAQLRDLKQLQRELRARAGREPWIVGVGAVEPGAAVLGPRLILDVLAFERQAAPGPLILWLGSPDHPRLAKRRPLAWLALSELGAEDPASAHRLRLALGSGLIDISQPQAAPAGAASLARAALSALRAGGLLRSRPPEPARETSP